jgi:hypothetical protein
MHIWLSLEFLPRTRMRGIFGNQPDIQRAKHAALLTAQQSGFVWMEARVPTWPPVVLPPLDPGSLDAFEFRLTPQWAALATHWLRGLNTSTWLMGVSLTYEDL